MFQIFDKDKLFGKKRQERQEMKKNIKNAVRQEVAQNKAAAQTKDFYETSAAYLRDHNKIDQELYARNNVKRGLRNSNGTGVVVGLTRIGEVMGYDVDENGNKIPTEGKLYYRGYSVEDLVKSCSSEGRFGFEEVTFLLIFGKLPTKSELADFNQAQTPGRICT